MSTLRYPREAQTYIYTNTCTWKATIASRLEGKLARGCQNLSTAAVTEDCLTGAMGVDGEHSSC